MSPTLFVVFSLSQSASGPDEGGVLDLPGSVGGQLLPVGKLPGNLGLAGGVDHLGNGLPDRKELGVADVPLVPAVEEGDEPRAELLSGGLGGKKSSIWSLMRIMVKFLCPWPIISVTFLVGRPWP